MDSSTSHKCTTNNANSTYSGCNRTACNYNAAKDSCENRAPNNNQKLKGYFRLPTKEEFIGWAAVVEKETETEHRIQNWMGDDGLNLCEPGRDNGLIAVNKIGSQICDWTRNCTGAGISSESNSVNACHIQGMWLEDMWGGGMWANKLSGPNYDSTPYQAASSRCVYDGINHSNNL